MICILSSDLENCYQIFAKHIHAVYLPDCIGLRGGSGARELIAALAQLGERPTEDRKVPGSIPGGGMFLKKFSNSISPVS